MAKGRPQGTIKTGGRRPGTPNRITGTLKTAISDFLNDNWDQVCQDWLTLDPEKRLGFYERLIRYIVPPAQDELSKLSSEQLDQLIIRLRNEKNEIRKAG